MTAKRQQGSPQGARQLLHLRHLCASPAPIRPSHAHCPGSTATHHAHSTPPARTQFYPTRARALALVRFSAVPRSITSNTPSVPPAQPPSRHVPSARVPAPRRPHRRATYLHPTLRQPTTAATHAPSARRARDASACAACRGPARRRKRTGTLSQGGWWRAACSFPTPSCRN